MPEEVLQHATCMLLLLSTSIQEQMAESAEVRTLRPGCDLGMWGPI